METVLDLDCFSVFSSAKTVIVPLSLPLLGDTLNHEASLEADQLPVEVISIYISDLDLLSKEYESDP